VKALVVAGEESLMSLTWKLASDQAQLVLNKDLLITEEDFYATLRPQHFVAIRTIYGGPSAETMKASLEQSREFVKESMQWLNEKECAILDAEIQLETFKTDWGKS
jgi:argininosuccinate lyase